MAIDNVARAIAAKALTSGGGGGGSGDMLAANNLSELTNKATARSNLGVAIGSNVQAYSANLGAIAGVTSAADKLFYFDGSGSGQVTDFTSVARTLVGQTTQALMRTSGLGMTSFGSSWSVAANAAAGLVLLGLTIGASSASDILDRQSGDGRYDQKTDSLAASRLTGTVSVSNLPASVIGGANYQGTWNASTNTPTLPAAATGNKGYYYRVSTAGSTNLDGITDWQIGDYAISNGTTWDKIDNTDAVSAVAGLTGTITASALRTALSLVVGTNVQAYSSVLTTLAGASSNGQSLITATDYAAMKVLLAVGISDVSGLTAALAGKADSSHTHSIANVTGLQDELDDLQDQIDAIDPGGGGGGSTPTPIIKSGSFVPFGFVVEAATLDYWSGRMIATPLVFQGQTIDAIYVNASNFGYYDTEISIGIYSADSSGLPDELLVDVTFTLDMAFGFVGATITPTEFMGLHYLVAHANADADNVNVMMQVGTGAPGAPLTTFGYASSGAFYQDRSYGALPSTFGAIDGISSRGIAPYLRME